MSPSTSTRSSLPVPTFESIGARTLINCQGTYTILTGSRALDTVVAAMAEATNHYVHMDDLMDKVGQRLAELTGAEWGYISSGCAAALTEITAACIAGADPERMSRLPDTTGMKNQVIMQRGHRNAYDRAI
ncbi:MAG: selenocysteine synthase, partial [Chloroflexi bacterium]|nr:selenocysteine synthase [Chloroflexota bacterium]